MSSYSRWCKKVKSMEDRFGIGWSAKPVEVSLDVQVVPVRGNGKSCKDGVMRYREMSGR